MPYSYSENKGDYASLWAAFKTYLVESIHETDIKAFEDGWKSCSDRTLLYFKILLPKIADKMGLEPEKEKFFRVDMTFYKPAPQSSKVPIIFIESENNIAKSNEEVTKLCCLNSPLKIVMVCTDWNEASKKIITEEIWGYTIEDFSEENVLTGYFAFIIAEWDETLKFHTYVYDNTGKPIDSEDCLLIEK